MCGLFGIINPEPKRLDKRAFLTLGVNNDTRGGDSCGVFIDGAVEYGYDKLKLFADFWPTSKLLQEVDKCTIALGHCRKASVGGIGIKDEKAQPVVITNTEGKIEFVLTHNGTIRDYEELAKKYIPDIDIKGMTDSQVMARIFYHAGYDVLGEYTGAGVFVTADYREENPKIHFFKGESKQYSHSVTVTEERPLFFVYQNSTVVYSSISDFLYTLFPGKQVYTLNGNLLCSYNGKEIIVEKKIDRSEKFQGYTTTTARTTTTGKGSANSESYNALLRDWGEDDEFDNPYVNGYPARHGGEAQGAGFHKVETTEKEKGKASPSTPLILNNDEDVPTTQLDIELSKTHDFYDMPTDNASVGCYILGSKDTFKYQVANRYLAHGVYKCTPEGMILSSVDKRTNVIPVYFFNGVPVKSMQCLEFLRRICEAWDCTPTDLMSIWPQIVYYLSPFPFKDTALTNDCKIHCMQDADNYKDYDGKIYQLFTDFWYPCKEGIISLTRYVEGCQEALNLYKKSLNYQIPTDLVESLLTVYESY